MPQQGFQEAQGRDGNKKDRTWQGRSCSAQEAGASIPPRATVKSEAFAGRSRCFPAWDSNDRLVSEQWRKPAKPGCCPPRLFGPSSTQLSGDHRRGWSADPHNVFVFQMQLALAVVVFEDSDSL